MDNENVTEKEVKSGENSNKRTAKRPVAKRVIAMDGKSSGGNTSTVKSTKSGEPAEEIKIVKAVSTDYSDSYDDFIKRKKSERIKKKGNRVTPGKLAVLIVIILAVLIGAAVLISFAAGFRYVSNSYRYQNSDESYSITYVGKIDSDGNPAGGRFIYPDGNASVTKQSDGKFVVEYSDESVYIGEMEFMHRHGNGTLTLANGDKYTGAFSYDLFNGYGTYEYSNGDRYEGTFVGGLKSGSGIYTWSNGDKYSGQFADNVRTGYGKYTYSDGTYYEGNFVSDKKQDENGKLVIMYADGNSDTYVGSFVNDMREGTGTYTWANGDSYTGGFKANSISGSGKYTWASGRTYEGEFLNGNIVIDPSVYPVA